MGGSPSHDQQVIEHNHSFSLKDGFFIFGQTSKGSLILKYTPGQIISYPSFIKFPKYTHCFLGTGPYAYMTGGVQQLQTTTTQLKNIEQQEYEGVISKKAFRISVGNLFNPQKPKEQGMKNTSPLDYAFKEMPEMINPRYSHCALENRGDIYVMGGREYGDDQIGILAACQKFSASEQKWKALPTLRYPRSGAAAVFYGDHIYIFGGYTGKGERSRVIESYKDGDKSWRELPYRLHEGIQGFLIIPNPVSTSSIFILGGKTDSGKSGAVYQINFDKSSVLYCHPLKEERCFHKGFIFDKKVHIIGGGSENIQMYDLIENTSKIDPELSFIKHCNNRELSSASTLQPQIKLSYSKKPYSSPAYDKKLFIFGHSKEPFTKIIDMDKLVVISQPQSLHHNFYKYPTVIRVNKQNCFVMGGLSSDLTKVSSTVYSVNLQTEQIKYLQSMKIAKYGFTGAVKGSFLYVVGGRKLGGDQVAILSSCERFSFQNYQWESIAPLKNKRHSALVTVVKNWLIVAGGYKGGGTRSNEVEMYIEEDNRWVEVEQKFEMAAESMATINYKDQVYIFGGRVGDSDIQKVFKFHVTLNEGMKFQKSITMGVEAVGNLTVPGTNLRVYLDAQAGLAYVFGNISRGIDVYDLKKNKIIQSEKLPVFQHLIDPLFTSYSIVF